MTTPPNLAPQWIGPLSAELLGAGRLARVPSTPGVYLWLRGFQLDPECAVDSTLFSRTVEQLVALPLVRSAHLQLRTARRQQVTIRPGLIHFRELTIGGGHLTGSKKTQLEDVATSDHDRLLFFQLLRDTAAYFGPVLYVGQASDLRQRVHAHVTSGTSLLELTDNAGITPAHLLLYCLPLPDLTVASRTLLEHLLTHMLIAPLTRRPG